VCHLTFETVDCLKFSTLQTTSHEKCSPHTLPTRVWLLHSFTADRWRHAATASEQRRNLRRRYPSLHLVSGRCKGHAVLQTARAVKFETKRGPPRAQAQRAGTPARQMAVDRSQNPAGICKRRLRTCGECTCLLVLAGGHSAPPAFRQVPLEAPRRSTHGAVRRGHRLRESVTATDR
jgi:hypothetical protein